MWNRAKACQHLQIGQDISGVNFQFLAVLDRVWTKLRSLWGWRWWRLLPNSAWAPPPPRRAPGDETGGKKHQTDSKILSVTHLYRDGDVAIWLDLNVGLNRAKWGGWGERLEHDRLVTGWPVLDLHLRHRSFSDPCKAFSVLKKRKQKSWKEWRSTW